jgi:hypothetical protein
MADEHSFLVFFSDPKKHPQIAYTLKRSLKLHATQSGHNVTSSGSNRSFCALGLCRSLQIARTNFGANPQNWLPAASVLIVAKVLAF